MIRGVNPWSVIATLAVVSLSSCGLSPEKKAVIAKARSIREFPVSRAILIASLGLEKQTGRRSDEPAGRTWVSCKETWKHPTGLTITAYTARYFPAVTRESIDDILYDRPRKPTDFIPAPAITKPPGSFDGFTVKNGRQVVFQSDEPSNDLPHVQ